VHGKCNACGKEDWLGVRPTMSGNSWLCATCSESDDFLYQGYNDQIPTKTLKEDGISWLGLYLMTTVAFLLLLGMLWPYLFGK
jgi:hypothetical protein